MKFRTRLAVLTFAAVAHPAFAQDAQIPLHLEQRLRTAVDLRVAAPASASLEGRDRVFQTALARDVSARVDAALVSPVRLGAVVARRASRVLYAAK